MHRRLFLAVLLLAATAAAAQLAPPPEVHPASILIRGGTLVDGSGAPRRRADVRIRGQEVAEIGALTPAPGERIIDAAGLIISPGFIDTHSHADGGLFQDPDAETMIRQGITTSVVGQDGSSHFPLSQYFSDLQQKPAAINIASFCGHGTMREQVMGKDYKRHATPEEIQKMRALVDQEMQSGAMGLSSGLEYDPGFYSTTEELIALAQVAGAHQGMYISHVRDEGNEALRSFRELIRIADEGHLPAQISHIKLGTSNVWGKADQVLKLIADANHRGLSITADVYPYTYWQSTITVLILSRDWDNRAVWQKGLDEVGGPAHVLLTNYTPDPTWAGKTIAQIAALTGKDPISVIQEIVRKTHGPGAKGGESVVVTAMNEADLKKFIASPRIMFCTDGGLHPTHPRGAGSYPRVLGRYVRQQHLLTLEQAIRKMTSLPAWRMGFTDRGLVRPGMKADLVIFNPETILDTATTAHPTSPPIGIPYVLVNGVPVIDSGQVTGAHPGMVLKRTAVGQGQGP